MKLRTVLLFGLVISITLLPTCRSYTDDDEDEDEDYDEDDFDPDAPIVNKLNKEGFVDNKKHIKEHLAGTAEFDLDNATPEELEFHFFKLHDTSGDRMLDGLELLKALGHSVDSFVVKMEQKNTPLQADRMRRLYDNIARTVDRILEDEDTDKDGYLSYSEYANSRRTKRMLKHSPGTQ